MKSAYYMQKEREAHGLVGSSSRDRHSPVWRTLWALQIPNAEKNFLWQACKEILPTRANLCWRKLTQDDLCPVCGLAVETTFHILWKCPSAVDIWSAGCIKIKKCTNSGPQFLQVLEEICEVRCAGDKTVCRDGAKIMVEKK